MIRRRALARMCEAHPQLQHRESHVGGEMRFVSFGLAYGSAPKAAGYWVGSLAVSNSRFMRRNRFSKNS